MKVLLIASYAESMLQFRGALLREIAAMGYVVHVAAPGLTAESELGRQFTSRGQCAHNLSMQRAGMNPWADAKAMVAMFGLMRRIHPDVVLSYTIKPVIYGSLAAWLAGVPRRYVLITGLGYAFTGKAMGLRCIVKTLVQILYRMALRRAQKVFFQNPDDETFFRQLGLLQPLTPCVVVNGSGIELASFEVAQLQPGPPHFLLIARLLGDKGVREYAGAAKRVRSLYPQVCFTLVGWIDENPDAIKQTELDDWIQSGDISYLGRLADVRPAIAKSTVYVLPSYREGTPRSVLEAMAMGRPIITTDAPGCRETVIDGENGFLVPVKSIDALVAAIMRYIIEPDLAVRMGKRSRQMAEEKYDVHKVNAVMIREMGL